MASVTPSQGLANQPLIGNRANILLVNKDPQDLAYYRKILQKLGSRCGPVRPSPKECNVLGASRLT